MTLLEPFLFVDARGRRWRVPRGIAVDGASIPTVFWSVIGGPFEGKYRNASIIHDYYCEVRNRNWQEVHKVFHEAMLASGVSSSTAFLMYKAVERFGPRWDEPKPNPKCLKPDGSLDLKKCTENSAVVKTDIVWPKANKADLDQFISEVEGSADPTDIEKLRTAVRN